MSQSKFSLQSIRANNYTFKYIEAGKGPLVIALHGFPDNPFTFEKQMIALAEAGYRVVAPFKRNFTPGDTTVNDIQHSSLYAQDVIALIDAFKVDKVILMGHDWGAGAAYGVAKAVPEKVRAIITMSIPLSQTFFTSYINNIKQMKRSWYVFFFQQASAEAAFQANDFAFIDSLWRDWSPHWNSKNEHLASVKNTFRKEGTTAAAVNYYRQSFGNYNLNDQELMKIQEAFYRQSPFTVPALYFHGKEDGCIGVENVEGMEHFFSNKFEKHIIDEAGHFVHLEKPQIVNRYILEFLKSIR